MAITLIDGTVLPDFPTEYNMLAGVPGLPDIATLQYCFVVCDPGSAAGDYGDYGLVMSGVPFAKLPLSETGDALEYLMPSDFSAGVVLWFNRADGSGWIDVAASGYTHELIFFARMKGTEEPLWGALGDLDNVTHLVWSNHDIVCGTMDTETGAISLTEEIYFPNSVSKPPFILPDGTELPALPDGCFDGTPYGAIVGVDWMGTGELYYSLQTMSKPILALPAAMVPEDSGITPGEGVTHCIAMPPCTSKAAGLDGDAWTAMETDDVTEFSVSFPVGIVLWANHDLCEVTELNEDLSYKVGSAVVRQSDENYRITEGWMRSIANEARRLGEKTGEMKPDETEATLRSTEKYREPVLQEKTVTPTFTDVLVKYDSGYDGLKQVLVKAAPSGGGGDMFQTSASGTIPVIKKGTAESVLTINFTTQAY